MDKSLNSPKDSFDKEQGKDTNYNGLNPTFEPGKYHIGIEAIKEDAERLLKELSKPEALNPNQIQDLLREAKIDPSIDLLPPPVCLEIIKDNQKSIVGTLSNFSMVIGKAKSRKTFFITSVLAAILERDAIILNRIKGILPDTQKTTIYFDTEQSRYHVQKSAKRVLRLSRTQDYSNFKVYSLRKYEPKKRLELIEYEIYNTTHLGFVVIDGIRDLIYSINDEEQATFLASKLLKWTEELNIHILCVLHQNKGDNNARGHLGTELQNKAESVLSITKDPKNNDISIIDAEYCREKDFEPFAFEIDETGLPRLTEDWELKTFQYNTQKGIVPTDIPKETHIKILQKVFSNVEKPSYGELKRQLKLTFNEFKKKMGVNKVCDFISWYKNEKLISFVGKERSRSSYYQLNEMNESPAMFYVV